MRKLIQLGLALGIVCGSLAPAWATETDQYLVWGRELDDCSVALNRYLNEELQNFLQIQNRKSDKIKSCEKVVSQYYSHVFSGLHSSRLRHWLQSSPEVDRFPDKSVSYMQYQGMSIYRGRAFPVFMPMARTIRVGEIYMGIDKVCHFFGFGRRYFGHYQRLTDRGQGEEEAIANVIQRGIAMERTVVGGFLDGVLSYGDLEANYQGMRMALSMCDPDAPFFVRHRGLWVATRELEIVEYMTPYMDESYNPSLYSGPRSKTIPRILDEEYAEKANDPSVRARFETYNRWEPGLSTQLVEEFFASRRPNPRLEQLGPVFVDFSSPTRTSPATRSQTLLQD